MFRIDRANPAGISHGDEMNVALTRRMNPTRSAVVLLTPKGACMKINLKSNYLLLGSETIDSIDFDSAEITLKDLARAISDRQTEPLEYFNKDRTKLLPGFEIRVNGRVMDFCENDINTVLRDGDTVYFYLDLLSGG
jgi:hypothetical protein